MPYADFVNDPQVSNVNVGETFSVTIRVDIAGDPVSVAEVHLNFDPALLQVVSLTPAPGSPLNITQLSPVFDNTAGTIAFGAFALFPPFPTTSFNFLIIQFQAVGASAGTQVTHELVNFPRSLIAFSGENVLRDAFPIEVVIAGCNGEILFDCNSLSPVVLEAAANACSNDSDIALPTAEDDCGDPVAVSGARSDNADLNDPWLLGTTTITWTFTAIGGATLQCTQTVTVNDMTPPVPDVAELPEINGECSATVTAAPTATDNCAGAVTGTTTDPLSYDQQGVYTITWSFTDGSGNTTTQSQTVKVEDLTPPTALCQDIEVFLDQNSTAVITAAQVDDGSTDNCSIANLSVSPNTFTIDDIGENPVILTVTDVGGLTATCTATVTVTNYPVPVALCKNASLRVGANGVVALEPEDVDNGSTVSFGTPILSLSQTEFTCADIGSQTVILTVTDANGVSSTCTATVTVEDKEAPEAICQDITVQLDANGNVSITAAHIDTGVFNAARIIRVGGTTNRKGDDTADRPHRRCKYNMPIEECPVEVVPWD